MEAFDGGDSEFQAQVSESLLARILVIVRTPNGMPENVAVDALERQITELSQSWTDRLHEALVETVGEEEGNRLYRAVRPRLSGWPTRNAFRQGQRCRTST